jgi:hypothetical protein
VQQAAQQQAAQQQAAQQQALSPTTTYSGTGLRVKLPDSYDGRTDVHAWLFSLRLALEGSGTPNDRFVAIASSLLQGDAAIWLRSRATSRLAREQPLTSSWAEFESDVKQQFTNVNEQQRARDRLADLRQTGSVRDYITQFRNVSLQILDMSAADQLDRFKRGLKDNVRIEVERDCSTLEECERIAERFDSIHFRARNRLSSISRSFPTPAHSYGTWSSRDSSSSLACSSLSTAPRPASARKAYLPATRILDGK